MLTTSLAIHSPFIHSFNGIIGFAVKDRSNCDVLIKGYVEGGRNGGREESTKA